MSSALHPDGKANPRLTSSNESGNSSIQDLIDTRRLSRRTFLRSSFGAIALTVSGGFRLDGLGTYAHAAPVPLNDIGFASVPPNIAPMTDAVTCPNGYTARVLVAWGDSLTAAPHWDAAGAMNEETQLHSFGAHSDGIHFFPFPDSLGNSRGLLVTGNEYCDPALVNNIKPASSYKTAPLTVDMVRAQQAAHGVSVVTVQRENGIWSVMRLSPFNRRITGNTFCRLSRPAAGHDLMKTAADPGGMSVQGTLSNCAHGHTPWGTYLTCEENWNVYFSSETGNIAGVNGLDQRMEILAGQNRYGIVKGGFGYRWHEVDKRFRSDLHPNEPNRFGWVVEIDPWDPYSVPIKRTALGRIKHEGAWVVVDSDNKVAVYMGDDERNEYLYKFVCTNKYNAADPRASRDLLDLGTLYVARFNSDGSGMWLPLVWGENGLTLENGFGSQAEVLIKTRQAADRLGATMMDRPEWVAVHPTTREAYLTLSNNNRRGNTPSSRNRVDGTSNATSANPPVDAANPRPDNDYGHIIHWREHMGNVDAITFEWDIFVQCGDKAVDAKTKKLGASYNPAGHDGYAGNIRGDDYGAPDGLWFDKEGRLWIQTDQAGNAAGDWVNIGGNAMMCVDPATGKTRRFLTSPRNCEVSGVATTPDGKTMFVGIQHPGEDWKDNFTENSTWPDSAENGPTTASGERSVSKPRSAVVVITKDDGGVIGS